MAAPQLARNEQPLVPGEAEDIEVSVVLPCLDEEESVASCVKHAQTWFQRSGVRGEVIVVDNGSTDRSREEARRAGARVIEEPRRGYGAAHRRGFNEARGKFIVMADADATYDLLQLDPLIEPLRNGYDMTVGNRLDTMSPGAMTWSHRFIGTPAISLLLRIFSGSRLGDSQCGIRAFTREAHQRMDLRSTGMELASEMILKASRRGLKVAERPVPYAVRVGETKLNTFRDGWRHLRFLLLHTPMFLFLIPGAVLSALGLLSLAVMLSSGGAVTIGALTWQPVFAGAILLSVGTNSIMIGMASHIFAVSRGVVEEDRLARFVRKHATLERVLALAAVPLFLGVSLDALLFLDWVSRANIGLSAVSTAALAQSAIIVGANLVLGGFLVALIDIDRPEDEPHESS